MNLTRIYCNPPACCLYHFPRHLAVEQESYFTAGDSSKNPFLSLFRGVGGILHHQMHFPSSRFLVRSQCGVAAHAHSHLGRLRVSLKALLIEQFQLCYETLTSYIIIMAWLSDEPVPSEVCVDAVRACPSCISVCSSRLWSQDIQGDSSRERSSSSWEKRPVHGKIWQCIRKPSHDPS